MERVEKPNARSSQRRAARACHRCRAKKYKCDEQYPCTPCKRRKLDCQYDGPTHMPSRDSYIAELERTVKELRASIASGNAASGAQLPPSSASTVGLSEERHALTPWSQQPDDLSGELDGVNEHTNGVEYHGDTSSFAFLGRVQQEYQDNVEPLSERTPIASNHRSPSILTSLHNVGFSSALTGTQTQDERENDMPSFYFRESRPFLEGFFDNLHYIHPIIDKEHFLIRCEDLWAGHPEKQSREFLALYFAVLSVGALGRIWDEEKIGGLGRLEWSRKLFRIAQKCLLGSGMMSSSIEAVQALIMMAKVCQNELNPHSSYIYLGIAVRLCLSAGFNRLKAGIDTQSRESREISRTWWGLYSLEIEMSFALGRPDTLGNDMFHNNKIPGGNNRELGIILEGIELSHLMREVSTEIYLSHAPLEERAKSAERIVKKVDQWRQGLREPVRVQTDKTTSGLNTLRDTKWAQCQRLTLETRYLNIMMVLHRPFLIAVGSKHSGTARMWEKEVSNAISSAKSTVQLLYDAYRQYPWFRSWWYSTVYMLFAASILLYHTGKIGRNMELDGELHYLQMAVEMLGAMEECKVAVELGRMIQHMLEHAQNASRRESRPSLPMIAPGVPGGQDFSYDVEALWGDPMTLNSYLDISQEYGGSEFMMGSVEFS